MGFGSSGRGRDFDEDDERYGQGYGYGRGMRGRSGGWDRPDFEDDDEDRYGRGRSGISRRGFPSIDPDEQRIVGRTGGQGNRGPR